MTTAAPSKSMLDLLNGFVNELRARFDLLYRVANQLFDLFRGGRATLRKTAHFGRDDSEASTLFARACGFHGCIQRQQVRLERDFVDDANDVRDLAAGGIDFLHRCDDALNDRAAFLCVRAGVAR